MKRRIISMILCIVMVISVFPVSVLASETDNLKNFTKRNTYTNDTFNDVEKNDWFYENVKSVYELGLMQGKGNNTFDTESGITIAETLTIAARLHSIYYTGNDNFEASDPWYQVYADYCATNAIASVNSDVYSQTASRSDFVMILANALPSEVFSEINKVASNAIPDVSINDTYGAAAYKMYRAGIMIGNDDIGTFVPSSEIKRSEVATIVTRMVDVSLRKHIQLGNEYTVTFNMNGHGKQIDPHTIVEGYTVEKPADPTKATYIFEGWYTQKTGGQQFDFDTPITEDITLYARWKMDPIWLAMIMGWMNEQNQNDDQTYTVTFDANGSDVENLPAPQTVKAGDDISLPSEPIRDGYIFTGWYHDTDGILAWDYRKQLSTSITVYAGWKEYGITTSNDVVTYQISDVSIDTAASKLYTEVTTYEDCYLNINITSEDQLTLLFQDSYPVNAPLEYEVIETSFDIILPQYFVIFAALYDTNGNRISNQYVCIEYTSAFEEFNSKTIYDFDSDRVISFDGSIDNNFAVSLEDVKVLNISNDSSITKDDNRYIISGNLADFSTMVVGSRYILNHNNEIHLINVNSIIEQGESIIITTNEVALADFFDYIKINSYTQVTQDNIESVNAVSTAFYSLRTAATPDLEVGEKISLSQSFKDPDEIINITLSFDGTIDNTFELWYGVEWKTIWYIPYPSPYFHLKEIVKIDSGINFDITLSNPEAPSAKTPYFEQKIAKVKVPILPAVNVEFELFIPLEINIESSLTIDVKYKQRAGFIYDLGSDLVKINDCEKSLEDTTQINGKVSVDLGVKLKGGFTLIEVLDLYLFAKAGFVVEGKANLIDFDAENKDSHHMCTLCFDCRADFYAELGAGATVSVEIKGWEIFDTGIKGSIPVAFSPIGDFYCSILNPQNSIHKGNFVFDWGDCPNIAWKTTFITNNASNVTTNDLINVHNNRSDSVALVCSGNSVFSEFLYNGSYIAKSTIDGTEYTQTFRVDDAAQTVIIKASNGGTSTDPDQPDDDDPIIPIPPVETNYTVSGRLISSADGNAIANMDVELLTNSNIHYDNVNNYTATSDANGYFSLTNVKAQTQYIFRSGDGTNFQYYQIDSVDVSQDTNLGTIQLIPVNKTATLLSGKEFNAAVKFLTVGTTASYSDKDTVIEYIEFTDQIPSGSLTSVSVSATDSSVNITAYWNESSKTITVYSAADEVLLNPDSSYMFYNFTALKGIDLDIADSTQATNMISMFNTYSPLSTVTVGEKFSFKGSVTNTAQYAVLPTLNEVTSSSMLYGLCNDGTQFTGMWKINGGSTLYTADEITEQDRCSQTVYVADSYLTAIFAYGFNNTIADLAGGKNQIVSIQTTTTQPSSSFANATISSSSYSADIIAYWNSDSKSIILYSLAEKMYINHGKEAFMNFSALEHIDMERIYVNSNDVQSMFAGCSSLKSLDTTNFNVSGAAFMHRMFANCSSLTSLDLTSFDTSKAETMYEMFSGCTSLASIDLSSFNTSYVIDMSSMFAGCDSLVNIDLSHFNFTNVCDIRSMFAGCDKLVSVKLGFIDNNSVELTYGEGHHYSCDGVKRMSRLFSQCPALKTVNFNRMNTSDYISMDNLFEACQSLESIEWGSFNTSSAQTMSRMFFGCVALQEVDLTHFETDEVTTMSEMFSACKALKSLDLSTFNTKNVTSMGEMFYNNESLESITFSSNFTTSNVTSMFCMFYNCKKLKALDLSSFNTAAVTTMAGMFDECESIESLDIGHFITDNVISMEAMFYGCEKLSALDISNFNSKNADLSNMFHSCYKLTSVKVGSKFSFKGNGSGYAYLPIPDEHEESTNFTGKWTSSHDGKTYSTSEITENDFCVNTTYTAELINN